MRSRNNSGRFTKKDADLIEHHQTVENEVNEIHQFPAIRNIEYNDIWVFRVIDRISKTLVEILIRLFIQLFFILLIAVVLKKIGMLDIFKEIFSMASEVFAFAKGVTGTKDDSGKDSGNANVNGKSYFS